jgi:hypothetical protein
MFLWAYFEEPRVANQEGGNDTGVCEYEAGSFVEAFDKLSTGLVAHKFALKRMSHSQSSLLEPIHWVLFLELKDSDEIWMLW